jgi:hypothetical protein
MKIKAIAGTVACVFVLGGCGGGGDERANTAEGFWTGTTDTGNSAALVVLEDGQTFGLTSSAARDQHFNGLYGSVVGEGTAVRGGSGNDFNFVAHSNSSITYSGTVSAKSTLSVSSASGVNFSGTYVSSYDQAAILAQIVGTYSGSGITGLGGVTQPMPMTIGADGTITFTVANCVGAGNLGLRGGGKNVFNLRMNFSGLGCAIGNGAQTIGIVVRDPSVTPARLYVMSVNEGRSDAFYWTGT